MRKEIYLIIGVLVGWFGILAGFFMALYYLSCLGGV